MPNEIYISLSDHLDESISILRVVEWIFLFNFNRTCCEETVENLISKQRITDQMPHSTASDLDLHCLPLSHRKDARLIWVNKFLCV